MQLRINLHEHAERCPEREISGRKMMNN